MNGQISPHRFSINEHYFFRLLLASIFSDIPHIKIMRVNNSEKFYQQVQFMLFVQLKQCFFL